jgi:hypothetical protein
MEYPEERCRGDVRYHDVSNSLEVEVDFEGWKFWKDDERSHARVIVELPYEPEIDLTAKIKAGEVDLELGDLSLRNFELVNWAGEVKVDFDRPNRVEMESFDVNLKVGESKLIGLGNARFEQGDINGGVGEMMVDFTGESIERCMARIDLDIGETRVVLPQQAGVKLRVSKFLSQIEYPDWFEKRGRYLYSENYDDVDKSLYLMISAGIGELDIKVE